MRSCFLYQYKITDNSFSYYFLGTTPTAPSKKPPSAPGNVLKKLIERLELCLFKKQFIIPWLVTANNSSLDG